MIAPVVIDPLRFAKLGWPHISFSTEQVQVMDSVRDNDETVVPAGNALGKDFVAAFIALWWMCSRSPARVVTTSVKYDQLNDVLWGEIRGFLQTCEVKLPIHYNHMKIRRQRADGSFVPMAELVGQCINKGESLLGRHLPRDIARTLVIFDEASGIDDHVYVSSDTWAHHKLIIGNPFPCENFFKHAVKGKPGTEDRGGDILRPNGIGYYRKVIRIKADQSPNIILAESEIKQGKEPSGTILIPGMKDHATYVKHRQLWDPVMQCIGLDADWYEGAEILMYPPEWLNFAEILAASGPQGKAKTIGVDSALGGDKTAWAVCSEHGILDIIAKKTPNTSVITGETLALMKKYSVEPENVLFDAGGGGKVHADNLREKGYNVRAIAFGGSATPEKTLGVKLLDQRTMEDETRAVYKNRRAEMYGILMNRLDPETGGFGIPREYAELRRQLAPIPKMYDGEGRLILPPKNRPVTSTGTESKVVTMKDLIGCSPDEADAVVLAVFGLEYDATPVMAGAVV